MVDAPKIDTNIAAARLKKAAGDAVLDKANEIVDLGNLVKDWGVEAKWVDNIVKSLMGWISQLASALNIPLESPKSDPKPDQPAADSEADAQRDAARAAAAKAKPDTQVAGGAEAKGTPSPGSPPAVPKTALAQGK